MKKQVTAISSFMAGFGMGTLAMFILDPVRGSARRAYVREQLLHMRRVARRRSVAQFHHLRHRLEGLLAETRSSIRQNQVSDEKIVARVASKIGRVVANSHSLGITADDGVVFLSGLIFEDEMSRLLAAVQKVKGVSAVENQLEAHRRDERVPGLQGKTPRGRNLKVA